mmetsp:Transcript_108935/g.351687  ORF Transcript_108935/g.351687 Transcript_108935/m.351687 type:complete len:221 (-) Transcript_108935:1136-1798(-)
MKVMSCDSRTLEWTQALQPPIAVTKCAAAATLISLDKSSALKFADPISSSKSGGMVYAAEEETRAMRVWISTSALGMAPLDTSEGRPATGTCAPCIQLSITISPSFMPALTSGSWAAVERCAMAASLATTFSRSMNSVSWSNSSSSSSLASASASSRSLVYLKICAQRWRTTESIRSKGCSATTLMLLLMNMPKQHMTMMVKQIRPMDMPASRDFGVERS